jgi:hypothetical protein
MNTENIARRHDGQPERMNAQNIVAPRVDIYENAERKLASEGTSVSVEFGRLAYHRVFALPRGIDTERVGAELKNGVLTLRLPKIPAIKPRRIEIKAS